MASFAGDTRHEKLCRVLVQLLGRQCPEGGGGYGGSFAMALTIDEVAELGGPDLIRSAMRKAARQLGWKVRTYDNISQRGVDLGVLDTREVPEEFADVVEGHRRKRMRDAVEALSPGRKMVRGSVFVTAQEFRAAYGDAE